MGLTVYGYDTFYLVKSNLGLTIQAIYGQCYSTTNTGFFPTCIIGIYVQYNDESLTIQFTDNINTNLIDVESQNAVELISFVLEGSSYVVTVNDSPSGVIDHQSTTIELDIQSNTMSGLDNNGNAVTLTMGFFNMEISASPIHYQQTQGHCNVYDSTPEVRDPNFHVLFNGDIVTKTIFGDSFDNAVYNNAWAASLTVDPSESGFLSSAPINYARFRQCTDLPPRITKRSLVTIIAPTTALNLTPITLALAPEKAEAHCKNYMGLDDSLDIEFLKSLSHSCSSDVALSGSIDFTTGYSHAASKFIMKYDTSSQKNPTIV